MSMRTHVVAFRPPDDRWQVMKAIYDACEEANIAPPKAVAEFFDWEKPDDAGVEIEIEDAVEEYAEDMRSGYQVDIRKLPKDVHYIRFYNAW